VIGPLIIQYLMLLYVTVIPELIWFPGCRLVFVVDHEVTTNPIVGRVGIIRLCGQLPCWRDTLTGRLPICSILPQAYRPPRPVTGIAIILTFLVS
jgi:hypothetical protein